MPQTITFTIRGTPITQGSMTLTRYGKMRHKPELINWRNQLRTTALGDARIIPERAGFTSIQ